ncbi:MAG: hypothetical protein JWM02_3089 [Frankiales bacterium]|nr:hypothetical protein [Frankiales bacterium]
MPGTISWSSQTVCRSDEIRDEATGSTEWLPSPGGLVTALLLVMRSADGAWVGWTGAGAAPEPFDADGLRLVPVGLTDAEVADHRREDVRARAKEIRDALGDNDVARWAAGFLDALREAPGDPARRASAKAER